MTVPLHLVACVKSKASEPCRASDLYQSDWFKKARAYVQARQAPWYILSALHGIVDPDEIIAPYEKTLYSMKAKERREWGQRVIHQLNDRQHGTDPQIVVLAGQVYRQPMLGWMGNRAIVPMQGLAIGQQLSWLKQNAK